jgi:hypothetical protein
MRRVRGTFVHFPRTSGFSPRLYIPLALLRSHLPRSISLPSLELSDLAPPLHSIVASEEELHCLDLIAVVLTPAAEIFTPPPP